MSRSTSCAGAGFVGIAVALMGRSHPAGIVPAAILFGMLYQGGAELAFEMPNISRDMIVIIQGLVILFAGALEHMFRPRVQAVFASFSPRSVGIGQPKGSASEMEFVDALINVLNSTVRVSVPLLLACLAGLYSERAGIFDIGLEGKMLAGAFAAARPPLPSIGSAWIGLAMACFVSGGAGAGARLRLDHPSRQPDRLRRRHQLPRRRLDHHPRPGLVPAGRPHAACRPKTASAPITLPFADALRDVPVIGQLYSGLLSGHTLLAYLAFLAVPFTWWVLFRTRFGLRLRAVGENPAAVDTAGISVAWLRYRAVICTGVLTGLAGRYMALSQNAGFVKDMTAGRGYIALAALIFAKWKPVPAMFACLLFGFPRRAVDPPAGHAAAADRQGARAAYAGAALHPHRHPARRLHRQGYPAARRRRALCERAVVPAIQHVFSAWGGGGLKAKLRQHVPRPFPRGQDRHGESLRALL